MDESRYHPQQDVFRLIDGKREPIQPYRFGQGENKLNKSAKAELERSKEPKGPYIKGILFDGINLTTRAIDAKGHEIIKQIPAWSGKPRFGDEFDYSKYRQDRLGGPIPEGNYSVNPQEVQRPTAKDDVVSWLNSKIDDWSNNPDREQFGKYVGGRTSWGDCRIKINTPPELKAQTGRSEFFIHGGKEPGSLGCIDLLNREKEFCEFIEKYRGEDQTEVPLEVKYKPEVKDVPDDEFDDDKRGADDSDKE